VQIFVFNALDVEQYVNLDIQPCMHIGIVFFLRFRAVIITKTVVGFVVAQEEAGFVHIKTFVKLCIVYFTNLNGFLI